MHTLSLAKAYVQNALSLEIKENAQINRSARGLTFCGYRVLPEALRLTPRKKRRFAERRAHWEGLYLSGQINDVSLQAGFSSALAITAHSQSVAWRLQQLHRVPVAQGIPG